MVRVRVQRIESIKSPDGNLGKRVELVEEAVVPKFPVRPPTEEARMVQEVIQVLQQQIPIFGIQPHITIPKIILFLTEHEYENLGVKFEVNQVYDVQLSNGTIRFRRIS
ncbi:hypothetical protein CW702_02200 [Candidatus Bathyarchaeota archaeon]|nr:MAG: hypothetical protein CW702_02200 [Candidatus Bathyarchaeota archaeon]